MTSLENEIRFVLTSLVAIRLRQVTFIGLIVISSFLYLSGVEVRKTVVYSCPQQAAGQAWTLNHGNFVKHYELAVIRYVRQLEVFLPHSFILMVTQANYFINSWQIKITSWFQSLFSNKHISFLHEVVSYTASFQRKNNNYLLKALLFSFITSCAVIPLSHDRCL